MIQISHLKKVYPNITPLKDVNVEMKEAPDWDIRK